ncbi:hypothetical protein EV426DRAFT_622402, partial [Tirmania nivea]
MERLSNSNGGISSRASRAMYTGMIRPVFTWGTELWHHPYQVDPRTLPLKRLEYRALRKVTRAYFGSSHRKLACIAGVEPLEAVKTGDGDVKNDMVHTKGRTLWHDGTDLPNLNLAGPIHRAFLLTGAEPDELSYGDRDDHRSPPILGLDIISADSKRSQEMKEWYTELAALKDSGWSLLFTDGTAGKNGEVAAAAVTH